MERFLGVCDGGKRKGMAYGSFRVFDLRGDQVLYQQFIFPDATSNLSEYLILIKMLEACVENEFTELFVFTDSLLVVNQVKKIWNTYDHRILKARNKILSLTPKFSLFKLDKVPRPIIKSILGH